MSQFLNFGDGHDGIDTIVGDPNIRTACSGSVGSKTLTVTSETGFNAGDMVMIHKSRGNTTTTAGVWELNTVVSTSGGQLNLSLNLVNAYQSSGANRSQCILIPQYSSLTLTSGVPASWDEIIGGIYVIACSGKITITGALTASLSGYANHGVSNKGLAGEGTGGDVLNQTTANGNGGGGTQITDFSGPGGGGNGSAGGAGSGGANNGDGGAAAGSADLTNAVFGGMGGAGNEATALGGPGGGFIYLISRDIEITTGAIAVSGGAGSVNSGSDKKGGGGGAGGSVLIKAVSAALGVNKITASAGSGGGTGCGAGGVGRRRVEACSITGSGYADSEQEGGQDYCGAVAQVIGG